MNKRDIRQTEKLIEAWFKKHEQEQLKCRLDEDDINFLLKKGKYEKQTKKETD